MRITFLVPSPERKDAFFRAFFLAKHLVNKGARNASKAKEKMGWNPKLSPVEGIRKLINWVLENKQLFT